MKIKGLTFCRKLPELRQPYLIVSFAGWIDAAQVATSAVSYLIRKWGAKKFAEIKGNEFCAFTSFRPEVNIEQGEIHQLRYPHNSFFYVRKRDSEHDLVLFRGVEPDLHPQKFLDIVLELATELEVCRVYTLGGFYDQTPHTRATKVSGIVSQPELAYLLNRHDIEPLDYQGPASIHSVMVAECHERSIEAVSLLGHSPFYVKVETNPSVSLGLLQKLLALLRLDVNLAEMIEAADVLKEALDRLLVESDDLRLYVKQMEEQYDMEGVVPRESIGGAEKIIREVEDFLRRKRKGGDAPPADLSR